MTLRVEGVPRAGTGWRRHVGAVAATRRPAIPPAALALRFTLRPGQWVDLDSLVESTVAGLRDAGWYGRGSAGLDAIVATRADAVVATRADAVVATRADAEPAGVEVRAATAAAVARRRPPGEAAIDVRAPLPRPVLAEKRAWRDALARGWDGRPPLEGAVWADVEVGTDGALLARLEVVLDALEPVLGRDPRGRSWQEFFPADDRITWLRTRRAAGDAGGVRLRLGAVERPVPGVGR